MEKQIDLLFMNRKSKAARGERSHSEPLHNSPKPPRPKGIAWGIFLEQVINATIVGGIAGIAALSAAGPDAGYKTALIAFGLTMLTEMRKYRNL